MKTILCGREKDWGDFTFEVNLTGCTGAQRAEKTGKNTADSET